MKTTDTPETDANLTTTGHIYVSSASPHVSAEFARKLERERNAAQSGNLTLAAERDALKNTNEKLDRIIALLSRPRILHVDRLDELAQLNERFLNDKTPVNPPRRPHDYLGGDFEQRCGQCGSLFCGPDELPPTCNICYHTKGKVKYAATPDEMVYHEMKVEPQLPPYPPVPSGYSHWEDRGCGWESEKAVKYAYLSDSDKWAVCLEYSPTLGIPRTHYIEAIKK
jgi:hypothetical protein